MIEREEFRYIELPVYEYENWIPTRVKEKPDPRVVVVRYNKDDLVVGIGIFDIIPSAYTNKLYTFLYCLAVKKDHRRRGLGSSLKESIMSQSNKMGSHGICFIRREDNKKVQQFYEKMGVFAILNGWKCTWAYEEEL